MGRRRQRESEASWGVGHRVIIASSVPLLPPPPTMADWHALDTHARQLETSIDDQITRLRCVTSALPALTFFLWSYDRCQCWPNEAEQERKKNLLTMTRWHVLHAQATPTRAHPALSCGLRDATFRPYYAGFHLLHDMHIAWLRTEPCIVSVVFFIFTPSSDIHRPPLAQTVFVSVCGQRKP